MLGKMVAKLAPPQSFCRQAAFYEHVGVTAVAFEGRGGVGLANDGENHVGVRLLDGEFFADKQACRAGGRAGGLHDRLWL